MSLFPRFFREPAASVVTRAKISSRMQALFLTALLMTACVIPSYTAELQKFSNARLISNSSNDGDSFHVKFDEHSVVLRLYFVDCPETSADAKSDAARIREQTRYFGLSDAARTVHFGNESKKFIERVLAKPFTVHTAFASALGRSSKGRVYGFVTTSDGKDLAGLLVKNGFARTHGMGRKTPDGVSRDEMIERLQDFEISAMLKRAGIWSESDSERIAELRAEQRSEDQELKDIQDHVKRVVPPAKLLDLNTAEAEELETVKGIGPVLAERIIAGRPYKTVDDLQKIKGISSRMLESIRPYFAVP